MSWRQLTAALLAATSLVAGAQAAQAADVINFELPQRWNDDFQPGTRCGAPGYTGVYLTAQRRWFNQTDATGVANRTAETVPVTHTVTDERSQTLQVSAKFVPQGDLAKHLKSTFGFNYVHEEYWKIGQVVGPYSLAPGKKGTLVWGFIVLDAEAQNVKCSPDQKWEPVGKPYQVSAPEAKYSQLRVDGAPDFN